MVNSIQTSFQTAYFPNSIDFSMLYIVLYVRFCIPSLNHHRLYFIEMAYYTQTGAHAHASCLHYVTHSRSIWLGRVCFSGQIQAKFEVLNFCILFLGSLDTRALSWSLPKKNCRCNWICLKLLALGGNMKPSRKCTKISHNRARHIVGLLFLSPQKKRFEKRKLTEIDWNCERTKCVRTENWWGNPLNVPIDFDIVIFGIAAFRFRCANFGMEMHNIHCMRAIQSTEYTAFRSNERVKERYQYGDWAIYKPNSIEFNLRVCV